VGEPIPGKAQLGSRWLRSSPPLTGVLGDIGFSAVTVANNHVMDFGAVALADNTIEACERAGVAVFGGGSTLAAATRPAVISKDGSGSPRGAARRGTDPREFRGPRAVPV